MRQLWRSVYAMGPAPASDFDRARARVVLSASPARGRLAGVLLNLDSVTLDDHPTRRSPFPADRCSNIAGVACVDALQALIDLATLLDDDTGEQALESALRRRLVTETDFDEVPARTRGLPRIERVLASRPPGAPATESLLDTFELDGQGHKGQPVYDARRETAVVAVTGWLPARATWHEVVRIPRSTARRWGDVADQCRRRGGAAVA